MRLQRQPLIITRLLQFRLIAISSINRIDCGIASGFRCIGRLPIGAAGANLTSVANDSGSALGCAPPCLTRFDQHPQPGRFKDCRPRRQFSRDSGVVSEESGKQAGLSASGKAHRARCWQDLLLSLVLGGIAVCHPKQPDGHYCRASDSDDDTIENRIMIHLSSTFLCGAGLLPPR